MNHLLLSQTAPMPFELQRQDESLALKLIWIALINGLKQAHFVRG